MKPRFKPWCETDHCDLMSKGICLTDLSILPKADGPLRTTNYELLFDLCLLSFIFVRTANREPTEVAAEPEY